MEKRFRNVNDAFRSMVKKFHMASTYGETCISRSTSRVGDVLYIQEPCTITYTHPRERVLFNQARDCNPFLHLYESLWMLAGRNDIAPLAYYAANYAKQVQDGDSPVANGAYGYRWRQGKAQQWADPLHHHTLVVDQLKIIVNHLKAKPDSRRCVLQMWNVEDDLLKIDTSKDVCCNTHAYFAIRREPNKYVGSVPRPTLNDPTLYLDMTVCNRSNDLIWGALGANVVHFSFLQEYLAACIGVEVGVYNQITNNLHVYSDRFEPEKWLADEMPDLYQIGNRMDQPWEPVEKPFPLVKDPVTFDRECAEFVERHSKDALAGEYTEPFLRDVAQPMCIAFHHHKRRDYVSAMLVAEDLIKADDWRIAATDWLLKRKANYEARTDKA